MTQSDTGLAKIVEGASPRRHAEISPVQVKDIHLMNNKHAHPFRSTSERSGAHMHHLFIDEIVEN